MVPLANISNDNGLHVFVFCSAEYKNMIKECVKSIDQYVLDPIISYNIISNTTIDIDGYNLINDNDLWSLLDPNFKYKNLYNHNWVKQQIFKLNLDKIVSGNVLIVDAEVRFQKPTQWITNNQYNIFYIERWKNNDSTEFVKQILELDVDPTKNFIVETTVFSTYILKEIRNQIEKIHKVSHMSAYQQTVFDDPTSIKPLLKVFMSEYDMYTNYLLKFHKEKIHKLINLKSNSSFLSIKHNITSNSPHNQTKWITFYQQIRDPLWPNCDCEQDFEQLPMQIQKEIIEIFGYTPLGIGRLND